MTEPYGEKDAIHHVTPGMAVVDVAGDEIGTVDAVQLADPGAATAEGGAAEGSQSGFARLLEAFGIESALSEEARERLGRVGYVRVDAAGAFSGRRYVEPDQIGRVEDATVHLSVRGDQLLR